MAGSSLVEHGRALSEETPPVQQVRFLSGHVKHKESIYKLSVLASVTKHHFEAHEDNIRDWDNTLRCPRCREIYSETKNVIDSMSFWAKIALWALHPILAGISHMAIVAHNNAKQKYPEHYAPEWEPEGNENV